MKFNLKEEKKCYIEKKDDFSSSSLIAFIILFERSKENQPQTNTHPAIESEPTSHDNFQVGNVSGMIISSPWDLALIIGFFSFFLLRLLFFPSSCVRLSSANSSSMKIIQLVSENSACRSDVWPQLFEINFHSLGKSWKKLIGLTIKKEKCVSCAFLKNCEKKNSIKILILVNQ